jgi:hypothetical protein
VSECSGVSRAIGLHKTRPVGVVLCVDVAEGYTKDGLDFRNRGWESQPRYFNLVSQAWWLSVSLAMITSHISAPKP